MFNDDTDELTLEEIAAIRKSEEEIARGDFVEWTPGMFGKLTPGKKNTKP